MKTAIYNKIKRVAMLVLLSAMFVPAIQAQETLHLFYKGGSKEKIEITSDTKLEFVKQPYMNAYWMSTDTIHLSASSGRPSDLGNVESNVDYTLSTDDDWLLARKGNLKSNWGDGIYSHYFIVYPTANKSNQSRYGKVTVSSAKGGFTKDFVVQQHPYMLTLDYKHYFGDYETAVTDTTVVLPWNDTTYYAIAYPNHGVEVASCPEWMELVRKVDGDDYCQFEDIMKVEEAQNAGQSHETYAYFRFAPNTSVTDRKGQIVFEAQGQKAVINIIQEGLHENTMIRAIRDLQQMLYTSFGSAGQGHHNDFGVPSMMLFTESRGMDLVSHHTGYNWFTAPLYYTDINSGGVPTYVYWYTLYYNIEAINRNVSQLKNMEDNQYARSYLAQAYALRAFDYFYLAQMYEHTYVGNEEALCVPIVTEDNMSQKHTIGIPRATVREVYDYILTNLDKAIALLQSNTLAYPDKEFISTEAAYGLRARINLVMNRWEAAAADAQRVIDAGVAQPYTRDEVSRPTFADINDHAWLWGINAEETDAAVISGTVNWPSHMGTFTYGYAQVGAWRMVNQSLFHAIPSTDVRKGWFLNARSVSPNLNEEQKAYIQYYGVPAYTQVKFAPYNNVLGNEYEDLNASDIPLMRIEEMYLILAEAKAMLNDVAKGAEVLNSFVANYRDPAYNCTASTAEELVEAVWMQRRIELWGEGYSYYDLMRLKKPVDRRGAGFEAADVFYVPDGDAARIYPIPAAEMNYYNPALVQNPEATQPQPVEDIVVEEEEEEVKEGVWLWLTMDADGYQTYVSSEAEAATFTFTEGWWDEVFDDVRIKFYQEKGVRHCVAYREGGIWGEGLGIEFHFTMSSKRNDTGTYDIDVPKQYLGYDYASQSVVPEASAGAPVYFYDWYNYYITDGGYSSDNWADANDFYAKNGANFPRSYCDGMGGFYFNLRYYVPAAGGGWTPEQFDVVAIAKSVSRKSEAAPNYTLAPKARSIQAPTKEMDIVVKK